MRKLFTLFIAMLGVSPALFAQDVYTKGLFFSPPPSDVSIKFLSDIFGSVDGILYGSSQLLGTMFGVFNAAVLGLGTVLAGYVIMVSTLNTAQDGEVLGRRWSSIWIPLRLVMGIGLLFPKASGYSVVQIIAMWLVVQGVGAADSVWNAVLSYLMRGGMIVTSPPNPAQLGTEEIPFVAGNTLRALVCMYGLEHQLVEQRKARMQAGLKDEGTVPSFTRGITSVTGLVPDANGKIVLNFPNLQGSGYNNFYKSFNGACGRLAWNVPKIPQGGSGGIDANNPIATQIVSQLTLSRSVAVQQMVVDLARTARAITNNFFSKDPLPLGTLRDVQGPKNQVFNVWVSDKPPKPPLLDGLELKNSAINYQSVIFPTLRAMTVMSGNLQGSNLKDLIYMAYLGGWILAGQYYFDLIKFNTKIDLLFKDEPPKMEVATSPNLDVPDRISGRPDIPALQGLDSAYRDKLQALVNTQGGLDRYIGNALIYRPAQLPPSFGNALKRVSMDAFDESLKSMNLDGSSAGEKTAGAEKEPMFKPTPLGHVIGPVANFNWGALASDSDMTRDVLNAVGKLIRMTMSAIVDAVNFMIEGINKLALNDLFSSEVTNQNPIVLMARFGALLLSIATNMWLLGGVGVAVVTAVTSIGSCLNPAPFAILAFLMWFIPVWTFLVGLAFSSGLVLQFFIPLVPYLVFTFAAVGWLLGVIEMMVAVVVWVLSFIVPEGHDLLGKSINGFILIISLFLRPSLMLFGFFGGIILSYVSLWLFNRGFFYALGQFYDPAGAGLAILFYPFSALAIYGMAAAYLQVKSMSLTYVIPDRITYWLGGGQGLALGGEVAERGVGQVQSGYEGGAKELGRGMVARMGSGGEKMQQRHEQRSSEKRGEDKAKTKDLSLTAKGGGEGDKSSGSPQSSSVHVGNQSPGGKKPGVGAKSGGRGTGGEGES